MKHPESGIGQKSALEVELEQVKASRFLNNFCGLLPGGYRRTPIYVNAFEKDDERTIRLLQQFAVVDEVIKELGLNIDDIERDNNIVGDLQDAIVDTQDSSLKIFLTEEAKLAKSDFFDRYEYPIYERLRRKHPDITGWAG